MMIEKIEAWFDGCCEPVNPGGFAAWGALVKIDGVKAWEDGVLVCRGPKASNNVAEYSGALAAMKFINKHLGENICHSLTIRGDSKLVIHQLDGSWNVNCTRCTKPLFRCHCGKKTPGLYFPFYEQAKAELDALKRKVKRLNLVWIPREENSECDVLSKGVLLRMGVKFRIQPEEAKA